MFERVIIDSPQLLSEKEKKLTSYFYLLADKVIDAYSVEMIRGNWLDEEEGIFISHYGVCWVPKEGEPIELKKNDTLVYENWASYEPGWGMPSDSAMPVEDEFIYSKQRWIKDVSLMAGGLDAKKSILLLASAGLEFAVPSFEIEYYKEDELEEVKKILEEERYEYLEAVSLLANQSFERINSGVYADTVDWARNESEFKINPAVRNLDKSLRKLNKSLLERLGIGFLKEGLPETVKTLGSDGFSKGGRALTIEILKILTKTLSERIEHRKVPSASYAIKLRQELQNIKHK